MAPGGKFRCKLLLSQLHRWCPVRATDVSERFVLNSSQVGLLPRDSRRGACCHMVGALVLMCPVSSPFLRSSYLITLVFMWITAAILAEICSALPLSGSIYIWAAESAGPKYARFFGFVVAWWSCTAWMTFAAGNCQVSLARSV